MESTSMDKGLQENQTHPDDDAATCIVDLRKVRDQYDIFKNSFKGKSIRDGCNPYYKYNVHAKVLS